MRHLWNNEERTLITLRWNIGGNGKFIRNVLKYLSNLFHQYQGTSGLLDSGRHSNVKFELVQKDDTINQPKESKPQVKEQNTTPLKSKANLSNDSNPNEKVESKEPIRKDWPDVGDFFISVGENFKKAGNAIANFFKTF